MSFSKRLKELRDKKGLSQEDLAKELGLPRTSITHYENTDRVPRQKRLREIADYFGVSMGYLLDSSDNEKLTDSEKYFIKDSGKMTVKELQEKYNLVVDGKPATEEEIKAAKAFIRSLRGMD